MSEIKIKCVDQTLQYIATPQIYSGDVNYDRVKFEFCSTWDGFAKTAVFYKTKDDVYYQLLDKNNSCIIPKEVLNTNGTIYIGVFGNKGDVVKTSAIASYKIWEGAITENLTPTDPTPDLWEQILAECAEVKAIGQTLSGSVETIAKNSERLQDLEKSIVTTSDRELVDSVESGVVINNISGKTEQETSTNKNVYDIGATSTDTSGVTFSEDSYTLTNVDSMTTREILSTFTDMIVGETYTLSFNTTGSINYIYLNGTKTEWYNGKSLTITQEMLNSQITFYGASSGVVTISNIQIEKGTTVTSYAPHGVTIPSPDYPQAIESVGNWFDGELLQGFYGSNGAFTSSGHYVCSKNKMPCVENDEIKLKYEEDANTLTIMFFDENGGVVTFENVSGVSEAVKIAPTKATYFTFTVGNTSITPQNAKHICVTINDTYGLYVKSVGKNLFNLSAVSTAINNVTFTVNNDKSVTINGKPTSLTSYPLGKFNFSANEKYIATGCVKGGSSTTYKIKFNEGNTLIDSGNGVTISGYESTNERPFIVIYEGVTMQNVTFYPMIRRADIEDDTYEPYKESVITIPLTQPLHQGDEIVCRDGVYGVMRERPQVIFDGSADEYWWKDTSCVNACFSVSLSAKKRSTALCTHYKYCSAPHTQPSGTSGIFGWESSYKVLYFASDLETVDEWKTWLSENPITVVYELDIPVFEPFEDQSPFYNLRSFNDVTYISTNSNLEPDITVDYATNNIGSYSLDSFVVAKQNQCKINELTNALLVLNQE